jgi:DNA-binding NarL/FixJ family response regulator
MAEQIRVVLADDHPLVRAGIRSILGAQPDIKLLGEAADGYQVQRLCLDLAPDILLLDLHMAGPSAAETVAWLHQRCPGVRVIVLTAYDDDAHVYDMVSAGVAGYVLKDDATEVVVQSIRVVARGGEWYSPATMARMAAWVRGERRTPGAPDILTKRELEVLRLMVDGQTNREIAAALSISEKTVEKHITGIFVRLGVASRVDAAVRAVREGMVRESPTIKWGDIPD